MGDSAENLKKATSTLLNQVVAAAVAGSRADKARTEADPNLFNIAQAHRAAERRAHELLDECIAAAHKAWDEGDITLGAAEAAHPAT